MEEFWIATLGQLLSKSARRVKTVQRRADVFVQQTLISSRHLDSQSRAVFSDQARLQHSQMELSVSKKVLAESIATRHTKLQSLLASEELQAMNTTESQIFGAEKLKVDSTHLRHEWSAGVQAKQQAADRVNTRAAELSSQLQKSSQVLETMIDDQKLIQAEAWNANLMLRMDTNLSAQLRVLQISEQEACNARSWGEWSRCSTPCGGGRRSRHRVYMDIEQVCEESSENKICNSAMCEPPSTHISVKFTEGSNWIQIKWDAPPSILPIELYQVRSGQVLKKPSWEFQKNITDTSDSNGGNNGGAVIFYNLHTATQYAFEIRTSNAAGWGNWSLKMCSSTNNWSPGTSDHHVMLHDQNIALEALAAEYAQLVSTPDNNRYRIKELITMVSQLLNTTTSYGAIYSNEDSLLTSQKHTLQRSIQRLLQKSQILEEHVFQQLQQNHETHTRLQTASILRERAKGLNLTAMVAHKFIQAVAVLQGAPNWPRMQMVELSWLPAGFSTLQSPHLMEALREAKEAVRKVLGKVTALSNEAAVISHMVNTQSPKPSQEVHVSPQLQLLKQRMSALDQAVAATVSEKDAQLSAFRNVENSVQGTDPTVVSSELQHRLEKSKQSLNTARSRLILLHQKQSFERQIMQIAQADESVQVAETHAHESQESCMQAEAQQNSKEVVIKLYLQRDRAPYFAAAHAAKLRFELESKRSAACTHAHEQLAHVRMLSKCATFLRSNMSHYAWVNTLQERVVHTEKRMQRLNKKSPRSAMLKIVKQFLYERQGDLEQAKVVTTENPCELSAKQRSDLTNRKRNQADHKNTKEPSSIKVYKEVYQKEKLRLQQLQTLEASLTSHTSKMRSLQERSSKHDALAHLAKKLAASTNSIKVARHWDRVASRAMHLSHVFQNRSLKTNGLLHTIAQHLEQQQMASDATSFQKDDVLALVHLANEIVQGKSQQKDRELALKATQKRLSQLSTNVSNAEAQTIHSRQVAAEALVFAKQALRKQAILQDDLSNLQVGGPTRSKLRQELLNMESQTTNLQKNELQAKQIANGKLDILVRTSSQQASAQRLSRSQEYKALGEEQSQSMPQMSAYLKTPEQMLLGSPLYAEAVLDTTVDRLKQVKEERTKSQQRLNILHSEQQSHISATHQQRKAMSTAQENLRIANHVKEQATKHHMSATSPVRETRAKSEESLALSELQRAKHADQDVQKGVAQGHRMLKDALIELKTEKVRQKQLQIAVAALDAETRQRLKAYETAVQKLETWRTQNVHQELGATDEAQSHYSEATTAQLHHHEHKADRDVKHAFNIAKRATSLGYEVDLKIADTSSEFEQIKVMLASTSSKQAQQRLEAHVRRVSTKLKALKVEANRFKKLREHMWEHVQLGSSDLALIRAQEAATTASHRGAEVSKQQLLSSMERGSTKLDSILDLLKISKLFHKLRKEGKTVSDCTKIALDNLRAKKVVKSSTKHNAATDRDQAHSESDAAINKLEEQVVKAKVNVESAEEKSSTALSKERHEAITQLVTRARYQVFAQEELQAAKAKAKERYDKSWAAVQAHRAILANITQARAKTKWDSKIAKAKASAMQSEDELLVARSALAQASKAGQQDTAAAYHLEVKIQDSTSTLADEADETADRAILTAKDAADSVFKAEEDLNTLQGKLQKAESSKELDKLEEQVAKAKVNVESAEEKSSTAMKDKETSVKLAAEADAKAGASALAVQAAYTTRNATNEANILADDLKKTRMDLEHAASKLASAKRPEAKHLFEKSISRKKAVAKEIKSKETAVMQAKNAAYKGAEEARTIAEQADQQARGFKQATLGAKDLIKQLLRSGRAAREFSNVQDQYAKATDPEQKKLLRFKLALFTKKSHERRNKAEVTTSYLKNSFTVASDARKSEHKKKANSNAKSDLMDRVKLKKLKQQVVKAQTKADRHTKALAAFKVLARTSLKSLRSSLEAGIKHPKIKAGRLVAAQIPSKVKVTSSTNADTTKIRSSEGKVKSTNKEKELALKELKDAETKLLHANAKAQEARRIAAAQQAEVDDHIQGTEVTKRAEGKAECQDEECEKKRKAAKEAEASLQKLVREEAAEASTAANKQQAATQAANVKIEQTKARAAEAKVKTKEATHKSEEAATQAAQAKQALGNAELQVAEATTPEAQREAKDAVTRAKLNAKAKEAKATTAASKEEAALSIQAKAESVLAKTKAEIQTVAVRNVSANIKQAETKVSKTTTEASKAASAVKKAQQVLEKADAALDADTSKLDGKNVVDKARLNVKETVQKDSAAATKTRLALKMAAKAETAVQAQMGTVHQPEATNAMAKRLKRVAADARDELVKVQVQLEQASTHNEERSAKFFVSKAKRKVHKADQEVGAIAQKTEQAKQRLLSKPEQEAQKAEQKVVKAEKEVATVEMQMSSAITSNEMQEGKLALAEAQSHLRALTKLALVATESAAKVSVEQMARLALDTAKKNAQEATLRLSTATEKRRSADKELKKAEMKLDGASTPEVKRKAEKAVVDAKAAAKKAEGKASTAANEQQAATQAADAKKATEMAKKAAKKAAKADTELKNAKTKLDRASTPEGKHKAEKAVAEAKATAKKAEGKASTAAKKEQATDKLLEATEAIVVQSEKAELIKVKVSAKLAAKSLAKAKGASKEAKVADAQAAKAEYALRKAEVRLAGAGKGSEMRKAKQTVKIARLKVKFQERVAEAATFKKEAAVQRARKIEAKAGPVVQAKQAEIRAHTARKKAKKVAKQAAKADNELKKSEMKLDSASTPEAKREAENALAKASLKEKATTAKAASAATKEQTAVAIAAKAEAKARSSVQTKHVKYDTGKAARVARKAELQATQADKAIKRAQQALTRAKTPAARRVAKKAIAKAKLRAQSKHKEADSATFKKLLAKNLKAQAISKEMLTTKLKQASTNAEKAEERAQWATAEVTNADKQLKAAEVTLAGASTPEEEHKAEKAITKAKKVLGKRTVLASAAARKQQNAVQAVAKAGAKVNPEENLKQAKRNVSKASQKAKHATLKAAIAKKDLKKAKAQLEGTSTLKDKRKAKVALARAKVKANRSDATAKAAALKEQRAVNTATKAEAKVKGAEVNEANGNVRNAAEGVAQAAQQAIQAAKNLEKAEVMLATVDTPELKKAARVALTKAKLRVQEKEEKASAVQKKKDKAESAAAQAQARVKAGQGSAKGQASLQESEVDAIASRIQRAKLVGLASQKNSRAIEKRCDAIELKLSAIRQELNAITTQATTSDKKASLKNAERQEALERDLKECTREQSEAHDRVRVAKADQTFEEKLLQKATVRQEQKFKKKVASKERDGKNGRKTSERTEKLMADAKLKKAESAVADAKVKQKKSQANLHAAEQNLQKASGSLEKLCSVYRSAQSKEAKALTAVDDAITKKSKRDATMKETSSKARVKFEGKRCKNAKGLFKDKKELFVKTNEAFQKRNRVDKQVDSSVTKAKKSVKKAEQQEATDRLEVQEEKVQAEKTLLKHANKEHTKDKKKLQQTKAALDAANVQRRNDGVHVKRAEAVGKRLVKIAELEAKKYAKATKAQRKASLELKLALKEKVVLEATAKNASLQAQQLQQAPKEAKAKYLAKHMLADSCEREAVSKSIKLNQASNQTDAVKIKLISAIKKLAMQKNALKREERNLMSNNPPETVPITRSDGSEMPEKLTMAKLEVVNKKQRLAEISEKIATTRKVTVAGNDPSMLKLKKLLNSTKLSLDQTTSKLKRKESETALLKQAQQAELLLRTKLLSEQSNPSKFALRKQLVELRIKVTEIELKSMNSELHNRTSAMDKTQQLQVQDAIRLKELSMNCSNLQKNATKAHDKEIKAKEAEQKLLKSVIETEGNAAASLERVKDSELRNQEKLKEERRKSKVAVKNERVFKSNEAATKTTISAMKKKLTASAKLLKLMQQKVAKVLKALQGDSSKIKQQEKKAKNIAKKEKDAEKQMQLRESERLQKYQAKSWKRIWSDEKSTKVQHAKGVSSKRANSLKDGNLVPAQCTAPNLRESREETLNQAVWDRMHQIDVGEELGAANQLKVGAAPHAVAQVSRPPSLEQRNCKLYNWGVWGACSRNCTTSDGVSGKKTRYRLVSTAMDSIFIECGDREEHMKCNLQPCPVACEVSGWGSWSICTQSCAKGKQKRVRTILKEAKHAGAGCPSLSETRPCNTKPCKIDSSSSAWSLWSKCSKNCDGGVMTRSRTIMQNAQNGGQMAAPLTEQTACNVGIGCGSALGDPSEPLMPKDCVLAPWSDWTECNHQCVKNSIIGEKKRERRVVTAASPGGKPCAHQHEVVECNNRPCPVSCVTGQWSKWTQCTKMCGGGTKTRQRPVLQPSSNGGVGCPKLAEIRECNTRPCPIDCAVTPWVTWTLCSKSCGNGKKERSRIVQVQPANGGTGCPGLVEEVECNPQPCPVNCRVSKWGQWSQCSAECATGIQQRNRIIRQGAQFSGGKCPNLQEQQKCNQQPCPVNCKLGSWSAWESCSAECSGGDQTRNRQVLLSPHHNGLGCESLKQKRKCNTHKCGSACTVSQWGPWSACTKVFCGVGNRHHTRSAIKSPSNALQGECGIMHEIEPCSTRPCPIDCKVSEFGPWSKCSASDNGEGIQLRERKLSQEAQYGGLGCPMSKQTKSCSNNKTNPDCKMSGWSSWSSCSRSCGSGVKKQTRQILAGAGLDGKLCGELIKAKPCNTQFCPHDCKTNPWAEFGACSTTCGVGQRIRKRTIAQELMYGGKPCGDLYELQKCFDQTCPRDCQVSKWSEWAECSVKCGGGHQNRTRSTTLIPTVNGIECPVLFEKRQCHTKPCSSNCRTSLWQPWGSCKRDGAAITCGDGQKKRSRKILQPKTADGSACGNLDETRSCYLTPCVSDCLFTAWSSWSDCSRLSTHQGEKLRFRQMTPPKNRGKACTKSTVEREKCEIRAVRDCVVSQWTAWSPCSVSVSYCGFGVQNSIRVVHSPAMNGGKTCDTLKKSRVCNSNPCPVACQMGEWNNWSTCTKSCGAGSTRRERQIVIKPAHGGSSCSNKVQTLPCNEDPCESGRKLVLCKYSAWSSWSGCSKTCQTGSMSRQRTAQGDKLKCDKLKQTLECATQNCPTKCLMSEWTSWKRCSASCSGGVSTRVRDVVEKAKNGGKPCGAVSYEKDCNPWPCPINCKVSAWGTWSPCNAKCGNGEQFKWRSVERVAEHGGAACPELWASRGCNQESCIDQQAAPNNVTCSVSPWTQWSVCSKRYCGGGKQDRLRTILNQANGTECPWLNETRACSTQACPINCRASQWGDWSACSQLCDSGHRLRFRQVLTNHLNSGLPCGLLKQRELCNTQQCGTVCMLSPWSEWSSCSANCEGGQKWKKRYILSNEHLGSKCGALTRSQDCNTHPCTIKCKLGPWQPWGKCSRECSSAGRVGVQHQHRKVITAPMYSAEGCSALKRSQKCNEFNCPQGCHVSKWGPWDQCSKKECGTGTTRRHRQVMKQPLKGAMGCPALRQAKSCNTCPYVQSGSLLGNTSALQALCTMSKWGAWSKCSKLCGAGATTRTRTNKTQCDNPLIFSETLSCNTHPCPKPGRLSDWGTWSACTHEKSSGIGERYRVRTIVRPSENGYPALGVPLETKACNTKLPAEVQLTQWAPWTKCSQRCDVGKSHRSRKLINPTFEVQERALNDPLSQTRECNNQLCPRNCKISPWSQWAECTMKCATAAGVGKQSRKRKIILKATNGGLECGRTREERKCNTHTCGFGCKLSPWSKWSTCDQACSSKSSLATQERSRRLISGPIVDCGKLKELRHCNTHQCPVNCKQSEWESWSKCSMSCGHGLIFRKRKVVQKAFSGGRPCGPVIEKFPCHISACPVDSKVSSWQTWSNCTRACGGGRRIRVRTLQVNAQHGGRPDPYLTQHAVCGTVPCPIDCMLSSWNVGKCSQECGVGQRNLTRKILARARFDGMPCGSFMNRRQCNTHHCTDSTNSTNSSKQRRELQEGNTRDGDTDNAKRVKCTRTSWGLWGPCSKTCDDGQRKRHRTVTVFHGSEMHVYPNINSTHSIKDITHKQLFTKSSEYYNLMKTYVQNGLIKECGPIEETTSCNTQECNQMCSRSSWSSWSSCSPDCGGRNQHRKRTITTSSVACKGVHTSETRTCNDQMCRCKVSPWSSFSECSADCGGGGQHRQRVIISNPDSFPCARTQTEDSRECNVQDCTVDCVTATWTAWSTCSKDCEGKQSRSRTVDQMPSNGGLPCGILAEARICNLKAECNSDCAVTDWAMWSKCSQTCGTGIKKQTRSVAQKVQGDGMGCPALSMSQRCNTQKCPFDCRVSQWEDWRRCSNPCGGGEKIAKRTILAPGASGGKECSKFKLLKKQECNKQACPINCHTGPWGNWMKCSRQCDTGSQSRNRKVLTPAKHHGQTCGDLSQKRQCNSFKCGAPCKRSQWSGWSTCDKSCAGGTRFRTRTVDALSTSGSYVSYTAKPGKHPHTAHYLFHQGARHSHLQLCGSAYEERKCNTEPCPTNCHVSKWSSWSECSLHCGGGIQHKQRMIVTPSKNGGVTCPALKAQRRCNSVPCQVHCETTAWSEWTTCSRSCGSGHMTRARWVTVPPKPTGNSCGDLMEVRPCNTQACAVDCKQSSWSAWGECSKKCGTGWQQRLRKVTKEPMFGGRSCGKPSQKRVCNAWPCEVDCKIYAWSKWSRCSKPCATGTKLRVRSIANKPTGGGKRCPSLTEALTCNPHPCRIDCEVGPWSSLTNCNRVCGSGNRTKSRQVITKPAGKGAKCPQVRLSRKCNTEPCPIPCKVGAWKVWTKCSKSCGGGGSQTRSRAVLIQPKHGATACEPVKMSRTCGTQPCPIDCKLKDWSKYSNCSRPCGGGVFSRSRFVEIWPKFGGKACGPMQEEKSCNSKPCRIDCKVSVWTAKGRCSKTCGGGKMPMERTIVVQPAHGGMKCPPSKNETNCNMQKCSIDCKLTPWLAWPKCSRKCGGGTQFRKRKVIIAPSNGGKECGTIREARQCNTTPCNSNCTITEWSSWSSCSKDCSTGIQSKSRRVTKADVGGRSCGQMAQKRFCNSNSCPIDCKQSSWTVWGKCDKSCGGGSQMRNRQLEIEPKFGGKACEGDLHETRACNTNFCPVACVVSEWMKGACSTKCGLGNMTNRRKVVTQAKFSGRACPDLSKTVACNEDSPCPIDCRVAAWGSFNKCSKACAGGHKTRNRIVQIALVNGGKGCPRFNETIKCNTGPCPVNCAVSEWKAWGACDKPCGGGQMARVRKIQTKRLHGGAICPELKEKQQCNPQSCPQACVLSAWTRFSKCSSVCGKSGIAYRSRTVKKPASDDGAACGALRDAKNCNRFTCNNDCEIRNPTTKKFKSCGEPLAKRIRDGRHKCSKVGKEFELTEIEHATGKCIVAPKWKTMDIKDKVTLKRSQTIEVTASLKATCPLSLHKKSGHGMFGSAKPFAACMTVAQKMCVRDERSVEKQLKCVHLVDTTCKEVCVEARFCAISVIDDRPGELVERKYGWRSPDGKACCYRDCILPKSWMNSKDGQLEPIVWCNQQASKS